MEKFGVEATAPREFCHENCASVGEVADDYGSFFSNFLPAAVAGTRFLLSPEHEKIHEENDLTQKDRETGL